MQPERSVVRRHAPASRPLVWLLCATGLVVGILTVPTAVLESGAFVASAAPLPSSGSAPAALALPILVDNSHLTVVSGLLNVLVKDTVTPVPAQSTLAKRVYTVHVGVALPLPLLSIDLRTDPTTVWAWPNQVPEGPVALPPLSDWTWTVTASGLGDSQNWSSVLGGTVLQREMPVQNATYTVTGVGSLTVPVTVYANGYLPDAPPTVGFVLNSAANYGAAMFPSNNPEYSQLAHELDPSVVRIDMSDLNTEAYWDTATRAPVFNFSTFNYALNWTKSVGGSTLLTLSAGSWGDGNILPSGMPVAKSEPVSKPPTSGYFAAGAAYATYVKTIVQHVKAIGGTVEYWTIGNEIPLTNATVVDEYIALFNVASPIIHATFPGARVGSDVMMYKAYLPTFAQFAKGVGFLSFHFYPSIGICVKNGTYCPPAGPGEGSLDARLWMPFAGINGQQFYNPDQAQDAWANYTGKSLPVLDTESNLNGWGGGPGSVQTGSDPRQQNLFGAAWTVSTLIDGAYDNLSELTYFTYNGYGGVPNTITGPYGGWGYGMTAQESNGSDVEYAPYWALHIWTNAVPKDWSSVSVIASVPGIVNVYAVRWNNLLSVVAVNQVDVPVTLDISVNGSAAWLGDWSHTLDAGSYVESYNAATKSVHLVKSGVTDKSLKSAAGPWPVLIRGYGVSAVRLNSKVGARNLGGPVFGSPAANATLVPSGAVPVAAMVAGGSTSASAPLPALGSPVASARWDA